ncbi:hypothetical protein LTR67_004853 [Exophiala xenobiotica]
MADWRERGYVPDSDDEEEAKSINVGLGIDHGTVTEPRIEAVAVQSPHAAADSFNNELATSDDNVLSKLPQSRNFSIGTVIPPQRVVDAPIEGPANDHDIHNPRSVVGESVSSTTHPAQSTAVRLEAELQRGLQTIQDLLANVNDGDGNDTDSPLSSLRSSPGGPPRQYLSQPETAPSINVGSSDAPLNQSLVERLVRRSFRPRNPIQLHPYALEDAKYRQSLKERGLQPVRVPHEAPKTSNAAEDDSQGVDTYESSQAQKSDEAPNPSSPLQERPDEESQSPVRAARGRLHTFDALFDDDLPELSDLLKGRMTQTFGKSTKGLKVAQRDPKPSLTDANDEFRIYDLPEDEGTTGRNPKKRKPGFILPPSPPGSRITLSSQDSSRSSNLALLPGSTTPALLPTPLFSSDKQGMKRFIDPPSSSDSETAAKGDDIDNHSLSSESSDDDRQGAQGIRRRIKGVLPASWLKLDIKKQQVKDIEKRHGRSPVKNALEKGLAKHVSRSKQQSEAGRYLQPTTDMLDVSADSESDEPVVVDVNELYHDGQDGLVDDVIEDNAIDAMLVPRARNRLSGRKKQQRLQEAWANPTSATGSKRHEPVIHARQSGRSTINATSNHEPRTRKRVKKKHKRPQMTVLDAPGFKEKEVPQFLRIAGRRKARFAESIAQEPSRKFFRLATTQDSVDVNKELDLWRGRGNRTFGSVAQSPSRSPSHAQARLQARSVDDTSEEHTVIPLDKTASEFVSLKLATRSTLQRIRKSHQSRYSQPGVPSDRPNPSASVLDYFVPRTQHRHRHSLGGLRPHFLNQNQTDYAGILPDPVPTLSRVPKPAKKRVDIPKTALPPEACPPRLTQHRRRKTQPQRKPFQATSGRVEDVALHDDNAGGDGVQDSDSHDIRSTRPFYEPSTIFSDLQSPPKTTPLQEKMLSPAWNFAQVGLLPNTVASMTDLNRMFHATDAYVLVVAPRTEHAVRCSHWCPAAKAIMHQAFTEISSIVLDETDSQQHATLLQKAAHSVQTLVAYISDSLVFRDHTDLKDFITYTLEELDTLQLSVSFYEHTKATSDAVGVLSILNGLMVVGYQISRLATIEGGVNVLKSTDILRKFAVLSFSLAFRKERLRALNLSISHHSENEAAVETALTECSATEIETIALIHQLDLSQLCVAGLNAIVSNRFFHGSLLENPADTLGHTILILAGFFTILGKDELSHCDDDDAGNSLIGLGFSALSNAVNTFIPLSLDEQRTRKKERLYVSSLQRFGVVVFQWCLFLARTANTGVADNLLRKMFKHYSNKANNMLDFFGQSRFGTPLFLDHQLHSSELVPESHDTDFDVFLKLLAFTLGFATTTDYDDVARERRIFMRKRSLIFSLLPNNGPDVEADKPLHTVDYHAMANRYLLFVTLYHYSPVGLKPELSYIRGLVEFGNAHSAVCGVVLDCWFRIAKSVISQSTYTSELQQLGSWIQDMIFQLHDKIELAPAPNFFDDLERYRQNRNSANAMICKIARVYAEAIDLCVNETQARDLLTGDRTTDLINLCDVSLKLDDGTTSAILNIVTSYLKKCRTISDFVPELHQQLRRIIVAQLGRDSSLDDNLLVSLVEVWFTIAELMIHRGKEDWDQYLSNWGAHSFARLAGNEAGKHCHILFMSKVATDKRYLNSSAYDFLELWLSSILKPVDKIKFEHILTNELIRNAPTLLALAALRSEIPNGTPESTFTREDLIQQRLAIIRHVVHQINLLQQAGNGRSEHGLTKMKALLLLPVIHTAMRNTWEQTPAERRTALALLMHGFAFELNRYPSLNFKVDSWYIDHATTFQDRAIQLEGLFICKGERSDHLDDEYAVHIFRSACDLACSSQQEKELVGLLGTTFSADDVAYIDDEGQFRLDVQAQLFFMKAVFPVWIERAFSPVLVPGLIIVRPILAIATIVLDRLEQRVDLEDQVQMEQFADMVVALLIAVGKALRSTRCEFRHPTSKVELLADLVSLCAKGCSRWAHLHQLFPTSERILALQPYVQTYGMYTYEYACSAVGLECKPSDPKFWWKYRIGPIRSAKDFGFYLTEPEFSDHEEVNRLRECAANDLENSCKANWHPLRIDANGVPIFRFKHPGGGLIEIEPYGVTETESRFQVEMAVGELVDMLDLLGVGPNRDHKLEES